MEVKSFSPVPYKIHQIQSGDVSAETSQTKHNKYWISKLTSLNFTFQSVV